MMTNEKQEIHESYGMVGFSRVTHGAGGTDLFASTLKHDHTIILKIKRAIRERSLSSDRYYGKETLIEVEMSPNQFAEAITALNIGDGTPCTIRQIGNKEVEKCPKETMRGLFEEEFKQSCTETSKVAYELIKRAQEILSQKTIKKIDRDELLGELQKISIALKSNLPFIGLQFNRAMDDVVADAKGAVEAFFMQHVTDLGVKTMQDVRVEKTPISISCEPLDL
jgi:hypothetical protein